MSKEKTFKHAFEEFFASPTRSKLHALLREQVGEENHLDFKEIWPTTPDLCKHIIALANSGGGCLIIGVAEEDDKGIVVKGLTQIRDKTDVYNTNKPHIPSSLSYNVFDFDYSEHEEDNLKGKKFQVLLVENTPEKIPFLPRKESTDLKNNVIYVRNSISTSPADYDALQDILERRVKAQFAVQPEKTLSSELGELKLLYAEIQRNFIKRGPSRFERQMAPFRGIADLYGPIEEVKPNPSYPEEDYETFIAKIIELKKKKIERLIVE